MRDMYIHPNQHENSHKLYSESGHPVLRGFFQLGFTPCKAEQPLRGMELQEKEAQKD